MPVQISKKRKFVQDGVFKAELNEFLTRELAEDGYSGVEVSNMKRLWRRGQRGLYRIYYLLVICAFRRLLVACGRGCQCRNDGLFRSL